MNIFRENMTLEGEDPARLVSLVNSSLSVMNEHQFFSWLQGEVHSLLPHEIMICGIKNGKEAKICYYHFSSTRYFRTEHFHTVCDPVDGLMTQMMLRMRETGKPCIFGKGVSIGGCEDNWQSLLDQNELRNAAAHGSRDSDGQMKSYFCFARVPEHELGQRTLYLLEILIPHLDATLFRVVSNVGNKVKAYQPNEILLSKREIQILEIVMAGKTNQEIAESLFLSPLTVKNHVQNIMKKLKVKSRGHAVTKGIKLGLFKQDKEVS